MQIRVKRSSGNIEKLDFETYLKGVVPSEIGRNAPFEAMKAQAVCARTYAYRHLLDGKGEDYDVVDTVENQAYHPEKMTEQASAAVDATCGIIMTYKGEPIGAWFSSSNRGRTKSATERWGGSMKPYSISRLDPFDCHGGGGHSVGMSQYGAMEMARLGYSYVDMLDFYYNASFDFMVLPYSNLETPKHGTHFKVVNYLATYYRDLKLKMKGEDVFAVKQKLVELGYLSAATHDQFGSDTKTAVRKFQSDKKLPMTGTVDAETWFALFPLDIVVDTEKFTRAMEKGMEGNDVKALQKKLIELGYDLGSYGADGDFGSKTKEAVISYQKANGLSSTGVADEAMIKKLFEVIIEEPKVEDTPVVEQPKIEEAPVEQPVVQMPTITRNLKKGKRGDDVQAVQARLIVLGYDLGSSGADGIFGSKTDKAVRDFQKRTGLTVDGIVGKKTLVALFYDKLDATPQAPEVQPVEGIPNNIGAVAAKAIAADLASVSELRQKIVLEALRHAHDHENRRDYPYSLYIRGGNLYNTDGKLNVIDVDRINKGAKAQPSFYNEGSKQMMINAVTKYSDVTGADCSGGIVGLLRLFGLVSLKFDTTADGFCGSSHSKKIDKEDLLPGDWVGSSGHIGLYVGGGYVVEWYGKHFGCALTKLGTKRKAWNFTKEKIQTKREWSKYRRPKYY